MGALQQKPGSRNIKRLLLVKEYHAELGTVSINQQRITNSQISIYLQRNSNLKEKNFLI